MSASVLCQHVWSCDECSKFFYKKLLPYKELIKFTATAKLLELKLLQLSFVHALPAREMASKPDELELFQSDVWNLPCSDNHLVLLSKLIADWKEMAPYLSLTSTDEVDILTRYPHSAPCRRREMLRIWSQKNGPDATYKKLALIFQECDRKDLFSKINELVTSASSMSCEG